MFIFEELVMMFTTVLRKDTSIRAVESSTTCNKYGSE
jgi:hypothetical protein